MPSINVSRPRASRWHVYFIRPEGENRVKIGVTGDLEKRIDALQTANHRRLDLLYAIDCESETAAARTERQLHAAFSRWRVRGEWFKLEGGVLEGLRNPETLRTLGTPASVCTGCNAEFDEGEDTLSDPNRGAKFCEECVYLFLHSDDDMIRTYVEGLMAAA